MDGSEAVGPSDAANPCSTWSPWALADCTGSTPFEPEKLHWTPLVEESMRNSAQAVAGASNSSAGRLTTVMSSLASFGQRVASALPVQASSLGESAASVLPRRTRSFQEASAASAAGASAGTAEAQRAPPLDLDGIISRLLVA